MPSEPIRLGPFVKGLNTLSDATSIDDLELVRCENFDLDIDGSLVSRPPINDTGINITGTGTMKMLGFFTTTAGASFLVGSSTSGTYYFDGTTWATITTTFSASAMAQYRDKAWLVAPPGSTNPGGKWDNTAGFSAVATMPKGMCIAVQKERLWIGPGKSVASNGSRVYFCAAADPDTWSGDFISINTGDGQNVIDIVVYFADLLLFKNDSTYRFSFDLDPATGTISRVSDTVGIYDTGCVTTFENRIFVLHDNNFFELSNYNYERLNDKVPFMRDNAGGTFAFEACVSYFSNRLFVSFFGATYVYSVRTRTWATWKSTVLGAIGRILSVPNQQAVDPKAYTQSSLINTKRLYTIVDVVSSNAEAMTCTIVTKNYDYQTASSFKRLFRWGVDCIARNTVTGTVTPIQYSVTITWGQAALRTWAAASAFTWGRGASDNTQTVDPVPISGITGERKFIKLGIRSLRFRQVGFQIDIVTDGSVADAPARIFNIVTWVKEKQGAVKKIN